jgi:uncharacterized protein DUF3485
MSLTVEPPSLSEAGALPTARSRHALGKSTWARVLLVVLALGIAGAAREWQSRRIDDFIRRNQDSPFPLKDLPLTFGNWKGIDDTLPSEIARATGCKDYIFRTYTDSATGVRLSLIVIYGPPMEVIEHAPEKCYPYAGYTLIDGVQTRYVPVDDHKVPFSSMVFQKGEGATADRKEVYYSWHYGQWTPARGITKQIERTPGMYKVHLDRAVAEKESREQASPCEEFLTLLIPEMDRRIKASASSITPRPPSS